MFVLPAFGSAKDRDCLAVAVEKTFLKERDKLSVIQFFVLRPTFLRYRN
jgi:hypothetical protein